MERGGWVGTGWFAWGQLERTGEGVALSNLAVASPAQLGPPCHGVHLLLFCMGVGWGPPPLRVLLIFLFFFTQERLF